MAKDKITFTYEGLTFSTADKTAKAMLKRGNIKGAARRVSGQSSGAKIIRSQARRSGKPIPKNIGAKVQRAQRIYGGSSSGAVKAKELTRQSQTQEDFTRSVLDNTLINSVPGELAAQLEQKAMEYGAVYHPGDSLRFNEEASRMIDDYYKNQPQQNMWADMERERALAILDQTRDAYELNQLRKGR